MLPGRFGKMALVDSGIQPETETGTTSLNIVHGTNTNTNKMCTVPFLLFNIDIINKMGRHVRVCLAKCVL